MATWPHGVTILLVHSNKQVMTGDEKVSKVHLLSSLVNLCNMLQREKCTSVRNSWCT